MEAIPIIMIVLIYAAFIIGYMAVVIFIFVLFVKLCLKALKAMDIYLKKPNNQQNITVIKEGE